MPIQIQRNPTRGVRVGSILIGGGAPIAVQSMCATKTQDVEATVAQAEDLRLAGAAVVRVAVDSQKDAEALAEIRKRTSANLVVDLQENYRIITKVAPHVDKVRYNPGHLYHLEKTKPVADKVKFIAETAGENGCALRMGVNCGSVDPDYKAKFPGDGIDAMVRCALDHCEILDRLGFTRYVVSLKDSDPRKVIEGNRRFAARRPDVPLHLGVTEAGLPPDGIIKTRVAFEQLISSGIGDTIRVSLTLPNPRKAEEVRAGHAILEDIYGGRFRSVPDLGSGLNIISCPSCSRVENEAFVELAEKVREITAYAREHDITIAVMGCRVNGPGETDDADLGLWCGASSVNLKCKDRLIGAFPYAAVLGRLEEELNRLIAAANAASGAGGAEGGEKVPAGRKN
ncbi:MAG: (E)-4-hydroxy-3-methylbut-2-enyl-diphosphate synthase [Planctomycetes bacterium]|nr:(E)-4-hydroxy-3-methylbut-2-enyl-diphosphate synthase [Planctomycetota bacterium]